VDLIETESKSTVHNRDLSFDEFVTAYGLKTPMVADHQTHADLEDKKLDKALK
jgi:hypothetical protein